MISLYRDLDPKEAETIWKFIEDSDLLELKLPNGIEIRATKFGSVDGEDDTDFIRKYKEDKQNET